MGLLDVASNVLTKYKADISEHKAAVKELQGEQKKLAQAELAAAEARKAQHDSWVKDLAKIGATVAVVAGAAVAAWGAFNAELEHGRLLTAAGKTDLEGLTKASLGLRSETQLLTDAAEFQHGAFKLNQQQMEMVERSMISLNRKGFESAKVHQAVTQAVVALKDDGLKDLGIFIDKAGLSMDSATDRATLYKRIMSELAREGANVKDGQLTASEGVVAAGVSLANSWDHLKQSLGQMVIALEPFITALAKCVEYIAQISTVALKDLGTPQDIAEHWKKLQQQGYTFDNTGVHAPAGGAGGAGGGGGGGFGFSDLTGAFNTAANDIGTFDPTDIVKYGTKIGAFDVWAGRMGDRWEAAQKKYEAALEKAKAWSAEMKALANKVAKDVTDELVERLELEISNESGKGRIDFEQAQTKGTGDVIQTQTELVQKWLDKLQAQIENLATADKRYEEYQKRTEGVSDQDEELTGRRSWLEKTFGKVGDFSLYSSLFQGLTDAIGGTYEAIVTGSEPAAQAFKKLIASSIMATGKQMLIEGVKEEAWAISSLASGDIPGFATHQLSAAKFFAGAALAGVVASELGAGGSTGSKGGGGGGQTAAPTAPPSSPSSAIIVVGDDFADDTPRMRQIKAQRLVGLALGGKGVVYE